MKLLHLTQYFFPEYSGTTTRLYNIVSRLPFNVQILASNRTVKGAIIAEKEEQFGNVKVNRIPLVPVAQFRACQFYAIFTPSIAGHKY